MSSHVTGVEDGASSEFGANEWLVDEMYEKYIVDKESVEKSWWPILEAYKPTLDESGDPVAEPVITDPTPTAAITLPQPTVDAGAPRVT